MVANLLAKHAVLVQHGVKCKHLMIVDLAPSVCLYSFMHSRYSSSFNPDSRPRMKERIINVSVFTDEEMEAQKSQVTCSR